MSDELIKILNDYDLIIEKMRSVAAAAFDYHSTNKLLAHSSVADMVEKKLKAAIDILVIR